MDARGFVIRIIAAIMLKRAVLLCIRFQFQKWRRQKHTMEESRRGWASPTFENDVGFGGLH